MRRRRSLPPRPLIVIALLIAAGTGMGHPGVSPVPPATPAAPPASSRIDVLLDRGVEALHAGLHERAETAFLEAARLDPGDPEPHVLRALSLWWRILGDRQDRSFDPAFHTAVEAAMQAARVAAGGAGAAGTPAPSAHHRAFVGMAHVLRFHIRGLRREFRDAARDARDGHDLLEAAVAADPSNLDALFALGAYNYFADSLPALARGIRVLMRVPQGDLETGLAQLRRLAESRSRLALHARLLLVLIEASDRRRCYGRALDDLKTALALHPASPLVHATSGTVRLRLGFHDDAAHAFADALEGAAGPGEEAARLRRQITLRLAESRIAAWRLQEAETLFDTIRRDGASDPRETQALKRLEDEIAYRRGRSSGPAGGPAPAPGFGVRLDAALAARGDPDPKNALKALRSAAALEPAHPLPHLLIGELLLAHGRHAEAEEALEAAVARAEEAPTWVAGWAEIDRGLALRALGRTRQARARFERASATRRFRSADRGLYEIEAGLGSTGRCGGTDGRAGRISGRGFAGCG